MTKVLSILLLFAATSAQASVQAFKSDDPAMIRPVRMVEEQPRLDTAVEHACGKPVLLFMRVPDGRVVLLGVFYPKSSC